MEMGELIMIEIGRDEYEEFIEAETRLDILRRLINDEDKTEGHYHNIDTAILRQILGMAGVERA